MQEATSSAAPSVGLVPPSAAPAKKKKAMPKGNDEILVMGRVERLLATLTPAASRRVIAWANGRQIEREESQMRDARSPVLPSPAERAAVSAPLDNGKY